ncbi:MAG: sce7726 family protein [Planctomycetota bacterium]
MTAKSSPSDVDIRSALVRRLAEQYEKDHDTVILEEVSMGCGAPRLDVLVVNGVLHGFELKSDRDTLKRLPRQASFYSCVLDHMTLVVGPRHLDKAERVVPDWWGITVAQANSCAGLSLSEVRVPQANPTADALAIARLLWRQEALTLLEENGLADGVRSKSRAHIHARLVESCDIDLIRQYVRQQFRTRTDWKSDVRQTSDDG